MRPDAKRANRRQRRTEEARGDKQGGSQNGNTRYSYVKSRRNLGLSQSWGICPEGYGVTTAEPQMALPMPRTCRREIHAHHQLCPRYHLTSLTWISSREKEKRWQSLKGKACSHLGKRIKAFPTEASQWGSILQTGQWWKSRASLPRHRLGGKVPAYMCPRAQKSTAGCLSSRLSV